MNGEEDEAKLTPLTEEGFADLKTQLKGANRMTTLLDLTGQGWKTNTACTLLVALGIAGMIWEIPDRSFLLIQTGLLGFLGLGLGDKLRRLSK